MSERSANSETPNPAADSAVSNDADASETVPNHHMSPDEFRRLGHQVVDWIAHYMETVDQHPVLSPAEPGSIRAALPAQPPEQGESLDAALSDLDRVILPGITHWQSPNFFAYFPSNASGPSILGELLSAGLGVQGMLWATSPACTELETHMLDWLVDLLGLPESFLSTGSGGGVIQDSASSAVLCAVLAAREQATDGVSDRDGCRQPLTVYTSSHAHSSLEKAVRIAGMGASSLRKVAVDEAYAIRPDDLARQLDADRAAGSIPTLVCATVGTTSSNAMDPIRAIAEVCRERGVWLHVDAAMSGTAAVCPEFRHLQDGVELADSYCFNPHKWMFTNFDCTGFWVADRAALLRALSILPEYLRNQATDSGSVIDYRDWHVPLGRRFRALKLWLVIRHYGAEGLRQHVRRHVELAHRFAGWVEEHPDFELSAPVPLNLVCFRHRGGDDVNQQLMDRLNTSGKLYLTHTKLDGHLVLRLAVGQAKTEAEHVAAAWEAIVETAAALNS